MEDLPYTVLHEELTDKNIVRFSGQLIINHIDKITSIIKDKLSHTKDVVIEVDNPDSLDVTFIQLFLTIKKTIESNGKKVEINANLSDDLKLLVKNSGFNYILN